MPQSSVPIETFQSAGSGAIAAPVVHGGTRILGVFGYPVEHSKSPQMHNAALASLGLPYIYIPFRVPPDALERALHSLSALGIVGVNLTIPHKEQALALVDEVTDEAREVGAVNTVHCLDGRLIADNTDGRGFYQPLQDAGFDVRGRTAVVIGAGGAARSVVFRLVREGVETIWLANRTLERAERLGRAVGAAGYGEHRVKLLRLDDSEALGHVIRGADLLVHTSRLGMYPEVNELPPIPLQSLHSNLFVYDLIYNPIETGLVSEARKRGCAVLGGAKMLVFQGAAAFERWTGIWPPTDVMEAALISTLKVD